MPSINKTMREIITRLEIYVVGDLTLLLRRISPFATAFDATYFIAEKYGYEGTVVGRRVVYV